ncbi:hypothetical protein [Candidatus Leptofilum sp.]|uniref:hypothetical protein n=1 Tax=Candidatus Leptofilum sp. TaxID=3241576 RepID=UPI003B58C8C1
MRKQLFGILIVILVLQNACTSSSTETAVLQPTSSATSTPQPTSTLTITPTSTPTNTATFTPTATSTPTETPSPKPTNTPRPTATATTSTWDRYTPRTIADMIEVTNELLVTDQYPTLYIEVSPDYQYPSQVEVIYTGEFREIDPVKQFLIETWGGTISPEVGESIKGAFQQEVLVVEVENEYWIPVQEVLVPFMKDELEPGDEALIFILWVGANILNAETPPDRVFILNEFRARLP